MKQGKKGNPKRADDFASVAARLECDPDMDKFDAKLKNIVKAKPRRQTKKHDWQWLRTFTASFFQ